MCTCFLILFFALSGFIATHADWFLEGYEHETVYDIRTLERAADGTVDIEFFCKNLVNVDAHIRTIDNDEGQLWYIVFDVEHAIRCVVHADEDEVEVTTLLRYPETAVTFDLQLAYILDNIGGDASHEYEDADFHIHTSDIESVWFEAQVMIFSDHGFYELSYESAPIIEVISDLHQGKHSNGFQTFLSDLTAILLIFVVVTGACIGLQMKKKRRVSAFLLSTSLVLTVILLLAR